MKTNKIALVTGGSRGIGKSIALSLAQKGIDVILTYNSQQGDAQATVAAIEATGQKAAALQLNIADVTSFGHFIENFQATLSQTFATDHFDFLINNAGTSLNAPIDQLTEAQFDEMMNIHVKGVFFLTQKLLPLLNDGGRIVNITSAVTRTSYVGVSAYAMMKGAAEVYTRHLALELGPRGIAVNAVAPGAVFGGGAMPDSPEMRAYVAQATALGRVAEPDDIGGIVAFLCSDDAKWINGQRIEATGGMHL